MQPKQWQNRDLLIGTIRHYSGYVGSYKIFLDPGHGGEDKGVCGECLGIHEADVNLKVAYHLKCYLQEAGAIVLLSRDGDSTISLDERVQLAQNSRSDLAVSIHHNASEDPTQFYCSTYYHATEGDSSYNPCSHDLARYIQRDLAYAIRISGSPNSFDGTRSDHEIYPGEGFFILKQLVIPSVLVECTFLTNEREETRLSVEEFNKIEAWGIFLGIARYLESGIPRATVNPDLDLLSRNQPIRLLLEDRTAIDPASLEVRLNSIRVVDANMKFEGDPDTSLVLKVCLVQVTTPGHNNLRVVVRNVHGNSCLPLKRTFYVR